MNWCHPVWPGEASCVIQLQCKNCSLRGLAEESAQVWRGSAPQCCSSSCGSSQGEVCAPSDQLTGWKKLAGLLTLEPEPLKEKRGLWRCVPVDLHFYAKGE